MEELFNRISVVNLPLVVFALALVSYFVYTFIIVYHLTRFGIGTKPKLAALVFFVGSLVLLLIFFAVYTGLDVRAIGDSFWGVFKNVDIKIPLP